MQPTTQQATVVLNRATRYGLSICVVRARTTYSLTSYQAPVSEPLSCADLSGMSFLVSSTVRRSCSRRPTWWVQQRWCLKKGWRVENSISHHCCMSRAGWREARGVICMYSGTVQGFRSFVRFSGSVIAVATYRRRCSSMVNGRCRRETE